MERLVKRKNGASKGNAKLKPRKQKEDEQIAYLLTDVKETVVTENFYQPVPLSILKYYMPKGKPPKKCILQRVTKLATFA